MNGLWEDVQHIDSLVELGLNNFLGPDEWEFTTIDSLPTLFVATGGYGNTAGSADFLVIPFNYDFTYSIYGISVDGLLADSESDATFSNSDYEITRNDLAKKKNNFAKYLERKFNQYNPVAKLEESDFDFNNPKNALKEWEIENASVIKVLEDEENSSKFERNDFTIKFTYHQNDITQYLRSLDMEPDSTENGSFIIYNFFKAGSCIWDKQKRKYFVAFVHENAALNPILEKNDNLFVADEYWYGKPFTINLKSGVLKFREISYEPQQ